MSADRPTEQGALSEDSLPPSPLPPPHLLLSLTLGSETPGHTVRQVENYTHLYSSYLKEKLGNGSQMTHFPKSHKHLLLKIAGVLGLA